MTIDDETFEEILYEDHDDFKAVTSTTIEDQTRWSVYKSRVFTQVSTGKFFEAYWGVGATENQHGGNEYWSFTEVTPIEVTVTNYSTVPNGLKFEGTS